MFIFWKNKNMRTHVIDFSQEVKICLCLLHFNGKLSNDTGVVTLPNDTGVVTLPNESDKNEQEQAGKILSRFTVSYKKINSIFID